jgi:SAM-dependent methyltransferase
MIRDEVEDIYRNLSPEEIPWNMEAPPGALRELVESGRVRPCRAIDLGCGAGNYAFYLAEKGFEVTGVDISPTAVRLARENAHRKGLRCDFVSADVLGALEEVRGGFDFACDWSLLHHIFPPQRGKYVQNVNRLLNPGGKCLSVSFCEGDSSFGGSGKYRKTPLGTVLYFSSEDELSELFAPRFDLIELKTIEISGKFAPHLANCVFMKKR